ncbi:MULTISPECIES: acyl-CoA thioesterase [unclassified Streptomyces]|uniref:acyl-CoA thioesterase n=1 Tax=unclassified Streptomyces TaxID=2593676 RepID=UPI002E2D69E1|nr:acyl-CoA thioesterase [Streptomyces sp. NBC_01429]
MTDQAQNPDSPIPGKPTSASRTTLSHIMSGGDTNLLGTVHGGVIMKLVDDAAGAVAGRHSGGPAVTASMDEMVFLVPVRVGDLVHVKAQVNWVGRSSMEIGVRVLAERWNESTPATQVGSAYLVFAAVDEEGRPRSVPPVIPETERDERRYQEAQIRRTHRLARRRAIKELRAKRAADGIDERRGGPAADGDDSTDER